MRSNIRLFLAMVLFAGATCAVAQDVNPTPPPPVPPQEATPAPLPDTQSALPPPVPTMVPSDAVPPAPPAPAVAPTKLLPVDTSVVRGKVPAPRANVSVRAEKKSSAAKADRKPETSKAPDASAAAAAAVAAELASPQPPSPGAPAGPAGVQAADPAAVAPPPIDSVPSDAAAAAAKSETRTQSMKSGGLWILLGIFVICVIGMAAYVSRRSGGMKELSILAGGVGGVGSEHRSPLVTGRHLT